MANVLCIAIRLLLTPSIHFHLLMDWLTCVIIVQLKEFRQAVEDRHTHLYQNPYYPPTTQSSRSNSKCWCRYAALHLELFQETCICMYIRTYIHTYMTLYVVHLLHACAYYVPLSMKPCIKRSLCAVKYVRMCCKVYITNLQLECNAAYFVKRMER